MKNKTRIEILNLSMIMAPLIGIAFLLRSIVVDEIFPGIVVVIASLITISIFHSFKKIDRDEEENRSIVRLIEFNLILIMILAIWSIYTSIISLVL